MNVSVYLDWPVKRGKGEDSYMSVKQAMGCIEEY